MEPVKCNILESPSNWGMVCQVKMPRRVIVPYDAAFSRGQCVSAFPCRSPRFRLGTTVCMELKDLRAVHVFCRILSLANRCSGRT